MNYLKIVRVNQQACLNLARAHQGHLNNIRALSSGGGGGGSSRGQYEGSQNRGLKVGAALGATILVGGGIAYAYTKYSGNDLTSSLPSLPSFPGFSSSPPPPPPLPPFKSPIIAQARGSGEEKRSSPHEVKPMTPTPKKAEESPLVPNAAIDRPKANNQVQKPPPKAEEEKGDKSASETMAYIHKLDKIEEMLLKANAELEKRLKEIKQPAMDATESALKAFTKAQQDLKVYLDRAYAAMENDNLESPSFEEIWQTLDEFSFKRDSSVREAQIKWECAWDLLCKLKKLIASGKASQYTDSNPLLKTAKVSLDTAEHELINAKNTTDNMTHEGELVDRHQKLICEFRRGLKSHLDSLLTREDGSKDDFSYRECNKLLSTAYKKTLESSTSQNRPSCGFYAESEIINQKKAQLEKEYETEFIKTMARQAQVYQETFELMRENLKEEYERKLKQSGDISEAEHLLELRTKYGLATAALSAMEKSLEDKKNRQEFSDSSRRLWAYCNSLYNSLNLGQGRAPEKFDKGALLKEYSGDEFVTSLLKTIPDKIQSNEELRTRFYNSVDKAARKMALMKEGDEFSLWKYALGSVQSSLVTRCAGEKESFGTIFEILDRTAFFLRKGDLLEAVIVLNHLRGFPRQVCLEWLNDARQLLEINQTLSALMNYAAANNAY